jgi:hypothetical protein
MVSSIMLPPFFPYPEYPLFPYPEYLIFPYPEYPMFPYPGMVECQWATDKVATDWATEEWEEDMVGIPDMERVDIPDMKRVDIQNFMLKTCDILTKS